MGAIVNPFTTGLSYPSWEVIARSAGQTSFSPADTVEHTYKLVTIPGGMLKANSQLRIYAGWDAPDTNLSFVTIGCYVGSAKPGPGYTDIGGIVADRTMLMEHWLGNDNAIDSQWAVELGDWRRYNFQSTSAFNHATLSVDFGSNVDISLYYELNNSADQIKLSHWHVEVLL